MNASGQVVQFTDDTRSFVTRQIAGETLIMPVAGRVADLESIYVLNEVGSRIWQLVGSPTTADRIVDVVAQRVRRVGRARGRRRRRVSRRARRARVDPLRRGGRVSAMETLTYGAFSEAFSNRAGRAPPAAQRHHRGDAPLSAHLSPLLQQPADGRRRGAPPRAHLRRALPPARRNGRRRLSVAAVHRRRDLRAS